MHGHSFVSLDEHVAEIEKRTVATGAVACAREALRIASEVDRGRIPRGRAEAVLVGPLGFAHQVAKALLDAKPEPPKAANQVPLVTSIQQVISGAGSADEIRDKLKDALDAFWRLNNGHGEPIPK